MAFNLYSKIKRTWTQYLLTTKPVTPIKMLINKQVNNKSFCLQMCGTGYKINYIVILWYGRTNSWRLVFYAEHWIYKLNICTCALIGSFLALSFAILEGLLNSTVDFPYSKSGIFYFDGRQSGWQLWLRQSMYRSIIRHFES